MGPRTDKNIAVFIDRDGTLIHEKHYLRKIKDVRLFSFAPKALKLLQNEGYKIIIVTNQSGIGRGYLTESKLLSINKHINKLLKKQDIRIDAVYYCPHSPDDKCQCRKPNLGMVKKARKEFNLNLNKSFVIGDHVNDFLLAKNMGGTGIFILTGHGKEEYQKIKKSKSGLSPDRIEKNLLTAARWIVMNR